MSQHKDLDLLPYAGRWVAIVSGRIAGAGLTPSQARYMAARVYPKERFKLGWVRKSIDGEIFMLTKLSLPKIVNTLRSLLENQQVPAGIGSNPKVYIVGGAIRDALLGRTSHDLDLAVQQDAVPIGRWIANQLGGSFYHLDPERGTGRVIFPGEASSTNPCDTRTLLDLALFREGSLINDLKRRDFTINSMALPLESDDPSQIIDPLGGQDDIAAGLVRATGPDAIHDDPVRSLRAVRQSTELGMQIHPETSKLIRQDAKRLPEIAVERVRDEIYRILDAPGLSRSLHLLNELDLLIEVFPELLKSSGEEIESTTPAATVLDRTFPIIVALEQLLSSITENPDTQEITTCKEYFDLAHQYLYQYSSFTKKHLQTRLASDRNIRSSLFLAALLHLAGKPGAAFAGSSNQGKFTTHDRLAAINAARRAKEFALSNQEVKYIGAVVGLQNQLADFLSTTSESPSRISIYRYFRASDSYGIDACFLGLASRINTAKSLTLSDWQLDLKKASILLEHFFHHYNETIDPLLLVNGNDLIHSLYLRPGPKIGQLLEIIREAQINGRVNNVKDAIELAFKSLKANG